MNNKVDPFVVVNYGNTCYIDSLIMAMFFSPSACDYILNTKLENGKAVYLQEIIKAHFLERVRQSKSVTSEYIDMIRSQLYYLGWTRHNTEDDLDPNLSKVLLEQHDVSELYHFMLDKLGGEQIKIQIETITGGIKCKDDSGKIDTIPFIPLTLPINGMEISVKKMLHNWMYDNIKEVERDMMTNKGREKRKISAIDVKHITNYPAMVGLCINRFQNVVDKNNKITIKRNNADVIIQKKISPFHNKFALNRYEWIFHAAICHKGDSNQSGHYYCLLTHGPDYYIFDDMNIPCMVKVRMEDKNVTDIIKKDCVFLIYRHE